MMLLEKGSIDLVLVPLGLVLMFGYHLILFYRVLRLPQTTMIGFDNHNKKAWVERMMQGDPMETGLALNVISTSISASTTLASLAITLSSIIGALVGSSNFLQSGAVYGGAANVSTNAVKYISVLACFLAAFASFVQSARYFVQASFLITTLDCDVPVSYVQTAVVRGGNFWTAGLRLMFLATTLLLWLFGSVPMFASSLAMVITLGIFDTNTTPLHRFRFNSSAKRGRDRKEDGASPEDNVGRQHAMAMHASPSSSARVVLNQPLLHSDPTLL